MTSRLADSAGVSENSLVRTVLTCLSGSIVSLVFIGTAMLRIFDTISEGILLLRLLIEYSISCSMISLLETLSALTVYMASTLRTLVASEPDITPATPPLLDEIAESIEGSKSTFIVNTPSKYFSEEAFPTSGIEVRICLQSILVDLDGPRF